MSVEQRRVCYQGRVQGVGFRQAAWESAANFDVVGYVRNLPDGQVELVAEGRRYELDRFLAAVGHRLERYIRHADCRTGEASGLFQEFEIRH
jgi:acylphosphatase